MTHRIFTLIYCVEGLMSLKECVRARTRASKLGAASDTKCFVPYRRNKLTLLMKDVFDIGCRRLCSTVVIATVSALALDIPHTANTLSYAAPLRVAVLESEVSSILYYKNEPTVFYTIPPGMSVCVRERERMGGEAMVLATPSSLSRCDSCSTVSIYADVQARIHLMVSCIVLYIEGCRHVGGGRA